MSLIIDKRAKVIKIGSVWNKFFKALWDLSKNNELSATSSLEENKYKKFNFFVINKSMVTGLKICIKISNNVSNTIISIVIKHSKFFI